MSFVKARARYFDAWNDHDPEAVVGALGGKGTYEDPLTGGPISADALATYCAGLFQGFPDVHFDIVDEAETTPTSAAARWRMTGTNSGLTPQGPATGGTVNLPGADFLTYDPDADCLDSVVGYFDTGTMLVQLGLQSHVSPQDIEGMIRYGIGMRVETGRGTVPGAFSLTWIEIDADKVPTLFSTTEGVVGELMGDEGYLGSCFLNIGNRHYTLSSWRSVDDATKRLAGGAHKAAMTMARQGELGMNARGVTSIWEPNRLNPIFTTAGGRPLEELGGQWL